MMIIDYSCGIKLSTATAFSAAINNAVKNGVLIIVVNYLEAMAHSVTLILDKTGTITFGNRLASEFFPVNGVSEKDLIEYSVISSLKDMTPEGKSIVELGKKLGTSLNEKEYEDAEFLEFSAQTKTSGINLKDGKKIRKGSGSSIKKFVTELGGDIPKDLDGIVDKVSRLGGTPLVLAVDNKIYGVIY